ncbi:MAG: restriction endonuclease [Planctomycetes bacterium]|nr:restriction endonuclease [Planctomycetota bacterium]
MSLEPGYDQVSCEGEGLERVRELAVTLRDCDGFEQGDLDIPYAVFTRSQQVNADDAERQLAAAKLRRQVLGLLQEMLTALEALYEARPQKRGKEFERWIDQWLSLYKLSPVLDIQSPGEQIDFTFWHGDLFVLGEARWRKKPVSITQIRDFFGKLLDRPPFAIGLVISMSGFTGPALDYLEKHSGDRTVLTMDREAVELLLKGSPELGDWLRTTLRSKLERPGHSLDEGRS